VGGPVSEEPSPGELAACSGRSAILKMTRFSIRTAGGVAAFWNSRQPEATANPLDGYSTWSRNLPTGLAPALNPVGEQIAEMTTKIKQYDRQIQRLRMASAIFSAERMGTVMSEPL